MDDKVLPIIGVAGWLIKGPLPERARWASENDFGGLSLLQSVIDADASERAEAADVIKRTGLNVTYHGNISMTKDAGGELDRDSVRRVADDVLWWRENGAAPKSVCFDPLHERTEDRGRRFLWEENAEAVRLMAEGLAGTEVRVGIENSFGGAGAFRSIADFKRFAGMFERGAPVMLYDLGHANIQVHSGGVSGEDRIDAYTEAIPLEIAEVHVHDNRGEKDEHKGIGYGSVDLEGVCRALRRRGFRGQMTAEVCVDILSGRYGADPGNSAETGPILRTRDAIRDAWEAASAEG